MGKVPKRTAVLLVNTKSRKGDAGYKEAVKYLSGSKYIDLLSSRSVTNTKSIDKAVDELLAYKAELFLIGSGDGTISHVIDKLVGTGVVMGILPLGTTNNYARTLGVPLEVIPALKTISRGRESYVDLAHINDDYFVNVASIGLSTKIARSVSHKLKKYIGRAAYAAAGLKELATHRAFTCEIEANGKNHTFKTHQLVIANGSYHSGRRISSRTNLYNGKLVVFSMDDGRKWKLLVNFIRFNTRGLEGLNGNEVLVAKKIKLTTKPSRSIELDGELGARTPVTMECVSRAIKVLLPEQT